MERETPYAWMHRALHQARRNLQSTTCGNRGCTRCAAVLAGEWNPDND